MEFRGYDIPEPVSHLIGALTGRTVLVLGNAEGVFEEAQEACLKIDQWPVFFGVNDCGAYMPELDHWISLHSENFEGWKANRAENGFSDNYKTHTIYSAQKADYNWDGLAPYHFPLSGYLAMQLAWVMGAEKIILCGCPGSPKARFNGTANDTPGFGYGMGTTYSDTEVMKILKREMQRLPEFRRSVKSMSGFSQSYFGAI